MKFLQKNNKRFNLDSKKLRFTSGFKKKQETLIHRTANSAIPYENLQIKEIHLHFEVKNSKSILNRVTLLLNLCLKKTPIFLDEEIKYVRLINGEAMQSLKV